MTARVGTDGAHVAIMGAPTTEEIDQRMEKPGIVANPDDVTAEWLTQVLTHSGAIKGVEVVDFTANDVGTGQVGTNVRFELTYSGETDGPKSVVGKFASRDETSRRAGIQTKTYETEVNFYRDLADSVEIRRPHCHMAEVVPGTAEVTLLFEDLTPAVQGDQIKGCTPDEAALAMTEAAKLHGPRWADPKLNDLGWLSGRGGVGASSNFFAMIWKGFAERYDAMLTPETKAMGQRLEAGLPGYGQGKGAATVVHADYRLDNMLFGTPEGGYPLAVVDWQTTAQGVGTSDVAYFLGGGLEPEDRRKHERDLVALYHDTLLGYGVTGYSLDDCWEDYRRFAFSSFLMAVFASMLVGRTERGDAMFMAMANRPAIMVTDLESEKLLG